MPHHFDPTILREYDIRGIVGQTLSAADARAIGRTYAVTLGEAGGHRVAVGYDGRLTSPELEAALVDGLRVEGADVVRIGRGPTPGTPETARPATSCSSSPHACPAGTSC